MRRIAVAALILAALAGSYWACSTDAPAPTPPTNPGGNQKSALLIVLFTTNANPSAGSCTLIQAIVTFNGKAVDDGTSVSFSTDLGVFGENSQPVVSKTTQSGSAIVTLCSSSTGTAFVNATSTFSGVSAKAEPLKIIFQPAVGQAPFFSNCSPSFGSNTGGTLLSITGGRFPGDASTTHATFTALGITREALVTSVTPTNVTLTTPAFPEAVSSSTPVSITLTFAGGVTLTVPNCFAFGTAGTGTPTITALLPSSGTKDGGTRLSIIGSGFSAPLQVFFVGAGVSIEAQVVSISFNQVIVLTPPAFLFGSTPPINIPIDVRVHEVNSGVDATGTGLFKYVLPIQITGISPLQMRADEIGTLTIFGHGFLAPILVTIGGNAAVVQSVSDTEVLAVPVLTSACAGGGGSVVVTNLNTGEFATASQSLTITAVLPSITSIIPAQGAVGASVTINGQNLPRTISSARVLFGLVTASVTAVDPTGTSITVIAPAGAGAASVCPPGTPPGTSLPAASATTVTVTNTATGCSTTSSFRYLLPCTVAPDLAVTKTAAATVATGTNLVYSISISNIGSGTATATTMSDTLDLSKMTFVTCTTTVGTCSNSGALVTGSIGDLPAGSTATVTLTVTVTAPAASIVGNTASASTSTSEPNLANNSSSANTIVTP